MSTKTDRPFISITCGDINGIGPEVVLKSATDFTIKKNCIPVLIGPRTVFEHHAKRLHLQCVFVEFDSKSVQSKNSVLYINIEKNSNQSSIFRKREHPSENISVSSIRIAVALCLGNVVSAMVTAPVSKEALRLCSFPFPGQTEFIASLTHSDNFGMMLYSSMMKIALATIHIPIQSISTLLTIELLQQKLQLISDCLINDFKILRPRIAVLGLNPHAGEFGLFGNEENNVIIPAIQSMKSRKCIVEGPFSADGFFGNRSYLHYDAVLAMYHDQGLIPLKISGMKEGVNFTMGLPIVRTSPAHGTAFDIAGKGIADATSMKTAILEAIKISNNRK
ncbi:MAG: 4-hydroxythreonine-4-phosphate dehydrogenase PdxA [Ignavibacteria bacterium]|nr:4-hydroxythreonine-4-phosphate dehydrogenase PdxA [Ignavibacteria bacterium]